MIVVIIMIMCTVGSWLDGKVPTVFAQDHFV